MAAPAVIPPGYVPPPQPPLSEAQERTIMGMPMNKETALMGAEAGLMMMGPVGLAASGGVSFLSADEHARNEMKRIVEQYGEQLSEVTGKPVGQLGLGDLEFAASQDKRFASLVQGVLREHDTRPVESIAALPAFIGGAAVGQAAIPIPIVGGMVGGMAAAMGAGKAVNTFAGNDPEQNVDYGIQKICDRLANGETVSTADVFFVRIHQDERMAEVIRNDSVSGKPFSKMEVSDQLRVMQDPEYKALADQCYYDAMAINNGGNPMDLVMGRVRPAQGQFTQAVMAGRPDGERPRNFRDAVLNQVTDPNLAL